MVKITITTEVETPGLPNFIRVKVARKEQQKLLDIAELTNDQLRDIGEAWTKALVEKAERRRKSYRDLDDQDRSN